VVLAGSLPAAEKKYFVPLGVKPLKGKKFHQQPNQEAYRYSRADRQENQLRIHFCGSSKSVW